MFYFTDTHCQLKVLFLTSHNLKQYANCANISQKFGVNLDVQNGSKNISTAIANAIIASFLDIAQIQHITLFPF